MSSVLDEIEKRNKSRNVVTGFDGVASICVNPQDLGTLERLARLAEQAATSVHNGGPFMNTDPEWAKEAWRILHPSPPAKGAVVWLPAGTEYHVSRSAVWLGSGMTLEESQKGFSVQGERERADKDAEIARLKAQLTASRGTFEDKEEIDRLRGALQGALNDAVGGSMASMGIAHPMTSRKTWSDIITRCLDALRGGK